MFQFEVFCASRWLDTSWHYIRILKHGFLVIRIWQDQTNPFESISMRQFSIQLFSEVKRLKAFKPEKWALQWHKERHFLLSPRSKNQKLRRPRIVTSSLIWIFFIQNESYLMHFHNKNIFVLLNCIKPFKSFTIIKLIFYHFMLLWNKKIQCDNQKRPRWFKMWRN